MNLPQHGSNPIHVYRSLNIDPPARILDFSVNTNPLGPPAFIKERWHEYLHAIRDYPDPEASVLINTLSKANELPPDWLLPGNGAAELIAAVSQELKGEKVLIIEPAFSEYRRALEAQGADIEAHVLSAENNWELDEQIFEKMTEKKALFICSPNNPTGKSYTVSVLAEVVKRAEKNGTLVVCDEAFYDFTEKAETLAPMLRNFSNLIILRSLTKMYAIAGLRLGYMMASPPVIARIKSLLPHWNVNALAQVIGTDCISDGTHAERTRHFIANERRRMHQLLTDMGFCVYPSSTNYYLLRPVKRAELYVILAKRGIITRHTENFAGLEGGFLRVAVKLRHENDEFIDALKEWATC
ncbi:threonine-phosphate decarboxylase CobD [Metabacillus sp. 113a]|uniref:threonine-phosphate decarboxylase CobD n=1 Tax=Metabacillus sp. 113a TaxID=3404706 RepID=UPI003CEC17FA